MVDNVIRTALRNPPATVPVLRVWSAPDWPTGAAPAGGLAVEWASQVGHPTSYALLGGYRRDVATLEVESTGPEFDGSLAGRADVVEFGLPDEYRDAVSETLAALGEKAAVTIAAHGRFGSSVMAFRLVAAFLASLMTTPDLEDAELWEIWAGSARRA